MNRVRFKGHYMIQEGYRDNSSTHPEQQGIIGAVVLHSLYDESLMIHDIKKNR
jgi:hypothetical protein